MSSTEEFAFDYALLEELTEARGVPGYEDRIRKIVRRELEPVTDEIRGDAMGNVVATQHGDADFEVAISAHMDEIGFMIRYVTEEGFAQLDALGGWDPRVLRAQRVTIHTDAGDVPGVLGSVPPHTMDDEEREKTPGVGDVHVDLGLDGERARERVRPGDLVTMDQETEVVGDHVTGKALDDRACLFTMIEAARRLDGDSSGNKGSQPTIHFAASVQEEVGLRGAEALGVDLEPDVAIALDVTVANDVPGFEAGEHVTDLGEGVAIKLKDSSVITSPKVTDRLREVADDREIPYQLEVLPAGGTDTAGFQTGAGATPVGALSIPTRYLHTVTESAHHEDIAATISLLTAALETETGEFDYSL
ncbi:peptidase M42 [Halobacteriales archaeon QS_3_64_16]|nr:MAG: peptidase M42 [Halobacteriales archaeon QS_3_64_16]